MIGISLDIPEVAARGGGSFVPPLIGTTAPTIFADFTVNHYYSGGTVYPTFAAWNTAISGTFARASSGTFLSGGVIQTAGSGSPRIGSQGLRLTSAATNLLLQSNNFATSWSATGAAVTKAQSQVGPDGVASSAWLIQTPSAGTNTYGFFQSFTYLNAIYTLSLYAKQGTYNLLALDFSSAAGNGAVFDLNAGTLVNKGTATGKMVALANGWYLCSITNTLSAGANFPEFYFTNASGARSFTVLGTETLSIFGAQLVQNSFTQDYVPTTTIAVTQAADTFSAAWSAITVGTMLAMATVDNFAVAATRALQIDDGTENNRATLGFNTSAAGAFDFLNATVSQAGLSNGSLSINTLAKAAAAFQVNDFALVVNNGTVQTDASGAIPAFSALRLGSDSAGGTNLQGYLAQFAVWNGLRGSNAVLGTLST